MPPYKLAAFDMDGTLLNSAKEIQPSAVLAFQRAVQAGRILALDTGRAVSELRIYPLTEMGIRYGSCGCGTIIYDFQENRLLAARTIPAEMISRIVEVSRKEDLMLQAMVDGISYAEEACIKQMDHYQMGVYQPLFEAAATGVEDIRAFALAQRHKVNKINLFHTDPDARERTGRRLTGLPLDITYAETTSFEITPRGVTKGTGLQDLCRVLGIPMEQTIGVGDAFNDIPMLRAAGLGVAMGNANAAVLGEADAVVGDNDHDGIAEAIDRYLIGAKDHTEDNTRHSHYHDPSEKKRQLNRISRAIGHLNHVRGMIENDVDCADVLIQLAAVNAALRGLGKEIINEHMQHCITHAIEDGDMQAVEEFQKAVQKFI